MGSARQAAALAFIVAGALPRWATAAEIQLEPSPHGTAGPCIQQDDLTFQVERALERPLRDAGSARFLVHMQPAKPGFLAALEILQPAEGVTPGFRTLSAPTCEALTQQVALAIALALGAPADDEAGPRPSPSDEAPREPVATSTPASPASPASPAKGPEVAASAWFVGDTGTLPSMAWGLGLGVELGWPSFELRAVGTLLPEREGNIDPGDGTSPGASIGLFAGGLLACLPVALHQSALTLSACGGAELGVLSGNGTGVSTPYEQRTLWAAARFDAIARWLVPQTSLALEALVTAAAPLSRDEFVLSGLGSVHRPESVVGRAALGVSFFID